MKILVATHNPWKAKLFGALLGQRGLNAYTPQSIAPAGPAPVESGRTVAENALLKARHYHSAQHPLVFADDAGLEIDALAGAPGAQFRRWGGVLPDDVSDEAWLAHLLAQTAHLPIGLRTAHLVDGWALITPDGQAHTYEARAAFVLATRPIRTAPPGAPILSVCLGLPDTPEQALDALSIHWAASGLPDVLQKLAGAGR